MGTPERTYQRTHRWISFRPVDLKRAPHTLWMRLGEATSQIEHIAGVPLRPDIAEQLHLLYLARGVHATTAIEGNSLSEEQVRARVEGRLRLPPSREYLGREVDNILAGYNQVMRRVIARDEDQVTTEQVRAFNRQVLLGLDLDEDVTPGEYRRHGVVVARYQGAPPADVPHLTERLCDWLNGADFEAEDPDLRVAFAIVKAVVAHVYLAWIHPFGDGNGRTARLLEYQVLVGAGVPTPAAHLLSSHYNLTRAEYYRQLDQASRNGGDLVPFLCYAVRGYVDQLREQLEQIRAQQLDVTWVNHVHQVFDAESEPHARRRNLVLDLATQPEPVPRARLTQISPRVAEAYHGRTEKTLARDLGELRRMDLVRRTEAGYVANREVVFAFLPARRTTGSA